MAEETLHGLDKRVNSLEEWRNQMQTIDLPSIRETFKEIPGHYNRKIEQSEKNTLLLIGTMIDDKLDKRFGWQSRILEAVVVGGIVALIVFGLGKL